MVAMPSGTVTFLYTDIEGSTRLWEAQPAAMRTAVDRHLALLRAAVGANGGRVFRTVGDGLCAAFATAPDAVAAALAGQQALLAEDWGTMERPRARMALHTGAAEAQGGDYVGACLNRIGRLLAAGHGGQVLLSAVTAGLVRDALTEGASLRDLGEQRLRDLGQAEHVYQLTHSNLPADFLPLRSLDAHRHNLPLQLTSFIGREAELAEVENALERTRLLTLTGTGGCGKTRLALQVANEVLGRYPDGVWFVDLAPLVDPALVPSAVAHALGIREQPGRPLLAMLEELLRPKRLLLVLDNCEHLLTSCAHLADALLRSGSTTQILATSREVLGIAGETSRPVPSLTLPTADEAVAPERLERCEAVRLFVERARAVHADFAVTQRNAAAVAQLCQRLDGIPLALELAAARTRLLTVEQLAERLDQRFRLLTGGSRTALPRQQTLRAAMDWTYDLLEVPERLLFQRLSVFVGGWTLEAAETVCAQAGIEQEEVLEVLARLVDKSLVLVEEQLDGSGRYRLLETLRQYGQERLLVSGDMAMVQERHALYYLELAEEAGSHLTGPPQVEWLERLTVEFDNIRAALRWCLEAGRTDAGLRLGESLFWHAYLRGSVAEGRSWLERLLAIEPASSSAVRAVALTWTGLLATVEGSRAAAHTRLEQGLSLARAVKDQRAIALATLWLGNLAEIAGDFDAAHRRYQDSLASFRALGDRWGTAEALCRRGSAATNQGNPIQAKADLEEALVAAKLAGDRRTSGFARQWLGVLAGRAGDDVTARRLLEESIANFVELGDRSGISISQRFMGYFAHLRGDYATALDWYRTSVVLTRDGAIGPDRLITALEGVAACEAALGQPMRAVRVAGACAALRESRVLTTTRVWPERELLERTLPQAREELDAGTAEAAWAEGQAMTLEQAIAYALEEDVHA